MQVLWGIGGMVVLTRHRVRTLDEPTSDKPAHRVRCVGDPDPGGRRNEAY